MGSYVPNVNKTVLNIINQTMLDLDRPRLVQISSCNLHKCHNIYILGMNEYGNAITTWWLISISKLCSLLLKKKNNKRSILSVYLNTTFRLKPSVDHIIEQRISENFTTELSNITENTKNISKLVVICRERKNYSTWISCHQL